MRTPCAAAHAADNAATTRGGARAKLDVSRAKQSFVSPAVGSVTRGATNALAPELRVPDAAQNESEAPLVAGDAAGASRTTRQRAPRHGRRGDVRRRAPHGETTSTRGCAPYVSRAGASDRVASVASTEKRALAPRPRRCGRRTPPRRRPSRRRGRRRRDRGRANLTRRVSPRQSAAADRWTARS